MREVPVAAEEPNTQEERQRSSGETEDTRFFGQESLDAQQRKAADETPDVTLDVPTLNLDEAHLKVENLRARISLQAELADMVRINVGVDAFLENVELDLNGLEAQALLEANLDNVRDILGRTLESMDNNPNLVDSLAQMAQNSENTLRGVTGDLGDEEFQDDQEDEAQKPGKESAREIAATGAARSKAEDLDVDLAQVEGTGSGGRITVRDVQKAASRS